MIEVVFHGGHVVAIVAFSVVMLISIIGNVFVLTRIIRTFSIVFAYIDVTSFTTLALVSNFPSPGIRCTGGHLNRMDMLLLHLTIADLFVTFFMMPVEFGWIITVPWEIGDILCRLFSFFRHFGLNLSGFVVMCISLDRYFAVLKPIEMMSSQAVNRSLGMICSAWSASFIFSLPHLWASPSLRLPVLRWYEQCISFQTFSFQSLDLICTLFGLLFMYILPTVITAFCYTSIIRELYRNKIIQGNCFNLNCASEDSQKRSLVRTIKSTVLIVVSFSFFWTPYNIMTLWYCIHTDSAQKVDPLIVKGLLLYASINSCVNPLIYGLIHARNETGNVHTASQRMRDIAIIVPVLCGGINGTNELITVENI